MSGEVSEAQVSEHLLEKDDNAIRLVVVDGKLADSVSSNADVKEGAFIGRIQDAPADIASTLVKLL